MGRVVASGTRTEIFARAFQPVLSIEAVELAAVGEEMLMFLSEIEANELAFEYLSGFGYYRINFVSTKTRRNLSPTLVILRKVSESGNIAVGNH